MLDFNSYPQWNPFILRIEGSPGAPAVGQFMTLDVQFAGGIKTRSRERISCIEPPRQSGERRQATLAYSFEGPLSTLYLVRGSRAQRLEQAAGGPTVYHTEESFRGVLRRFVPVGAVQDGFERHAQALKVRAESLAQAAPKK